MSNVSVIPFATTILVRDSCLCLHAQRAARALARLFDNALKPVGINNGQFSLLMSLNRPEPPPMGPVANLLAMDRTTLTAALNGCGWRLRGWPYSPQRSRYGSRPMRKSKQRLEAVTLKDCAATSSILADRGGAPRQDCHPVVAPESETERNAIQEE